MLIVSCGMIMDSDWMKFILYSNMIKTSLNSDGKDVSATHWQYYSILQGKKWKRNLKSVQDLQLFFQRTVIEQGNSKCESNENGLIK